MAKAYDESSIKTLGKLEAIRTRPGMYIGALGDGTDPRDGIYTLFKEAVDNSVDEFFEGFGNTIYITADEKSISVKDSGRGIPHGKLLDCVTNTHTGGKFNNDIYTTSSGLNGVGIKAVNALSSSFVVTSTREGKSVTLEFSKGEQINKSSKKVKDDTTGTEISFTPDDDEKLFKDYKFDLNILTSIVNDYVYLNSGLTIIFNEKKFSSRKGLPGLLATKIGDSEPSYPMIQYAEKDRSIEFAFTHLNTSCNEEFFSYANGKYTIDAGNHQSYFKEALAKAINDFYGKSWSTNDIRSSMVAAISVRVKNPLFDSQTKVRLTNSEPEFRSMIFDTVRDKVQDFLLKNPPVAKSLQNRINEIEKANKEYNDAKKGARESQARTKLNIPKLRDSKYHRGGRSAKAIEEGKKTMIFICEGDSAAGTITSARNVEYQAVFPVRGKVYNVCGNTKSIIYKKEKENSHELYNIMASLGIEDSIDDLRYEKVIIATDADEDGYHIRMLLMTYFLTLFDSLVTSGHLYILETPLFRVRNKEKTKYCYSEAERDKALEEIKRAEVTRFKGLGEINPKEFKPFISTQMHLTQVTTESIAQMKKDVEFYMGKNTQERTTFLMENMVSV